VLSRRRWHFEAVLLLGDGHEPFSVSVSSGGGREDGSVAGLPVSSMNFSMFPACLKSTCALAGTSSGFLCEWRRSLGDQRSSACRERTVLIQKLELPFKDVIGFVFSMVHVGRWGDCGTAVTSKRVNAPTVSSPTTLVVY
jgi:hypothetical protein